jgi:hypothetical protein
MEDRMSIVIASHNPTLFARVVRRSPLFYIEGADPTLDRPAHVRAGSGLARIGGYLAVVQDDANFVALIEEQSRRVYPITLPVGADGGRQFDDGRGNKPLKLDLESCVVVPSEKGDLLVAFGSGSTSRREWVLVVSGVQHNAPAVTLHHASALYSGLRAAHEFSGSEMNIEGAVWTEGRIRLFNRGNGAPGNDLLPVDATCDLEWSRLWKHLQDPKGIASPPPQAILEYDLGTLDGQRLGFTDATVGPAGILFFSATAEDSPDAYHDGPVVGSILGVLRGGKHAEWAVLADSNGNRFNGKVEGLFIPPECPRQAYVVVDRDDPDDPSELCEVELAGPWFNDE